MEEAAGGRPDAQSVRGAKEQRRQRERRFLTPNPLFDHHSPTTQHQVADAFHQHPELARIAVDPFMPVKAKASVVESLFKDSPATEITKRLFGALAEENALAATLKVADAFDELMLAHRKEVHCTIVTAEVR